MEWAQRRFNRRTAGIHDVAESGRLSSDLSGFSLMELFRMEAESHTTMLSAGLVALEGASATPQVLNHSCARRTH